MIAPTSQNHDAINDATPDAALAAHFLDEVPGRTDDVRIDAEGGRRPSGGGM